MNKRFELIYHEVQRQYRSERAFYQTLGITQRAWEKYKTGETEFANIKLSTYQRMIGLLFTRYETFVIDMAVEETNFNCHENVIDAFHAIRMKQSRYFVNQGADIQIASGRFETGQPKRNSITQIYIKGPFDQTLSFFVDTPPHKIPSGKQNRKEWFENEFPNLVVK